MTRTSRLKLSLLFGASLGAALSVGLPAQAGSYSAEYVFGDSLSDRGNLDEYYAHKLWSICQFQSWLSNANRLQELTTEREIETQDLIPIRNSSTC